MRGRRPTPTAILIARGTFCRDRHGSCIDAPGSAPAAEMTPSELTVDEQAKRKAEIEAQRKAIYGEAGPPDPGPRSGGSVKRIRW